MECDMAIFDVHGRHSVPISVQWDCRPHKATGLEVFKHQPKSLIVVSQRNVFKSVLSQKCLIRNV